MKVKLIIVFIAIIFILSSCAQTDTFGQIQRPESSQSKDGIEEDISQEKEVFWTPTGKKYHTDKSCKTLSKSKTIKSGSVDQANDAGKSSSCKVCAEPNNKTV